VLHALNMAHQPPPLPAYAGDIQVQRASYGIYPLRCRTELTHVPVVVSRSCSNPKCCCLGLQRFASLVKKKKHVLPLAFASGGVIFCLDI